MSRLFSLTLLCTVSVDSHRSKIVFFFFFTLIFVNKGNLCYFGSDILKKILPPLHQLHLDCNYYYFLNIMVRVKIIHDLNIMSSYCPALDSSLF